jgi:hypothetical protein
MAKQQQGAGVTNRAKIDLTLAQRIRRARLGYAETPNFLPPRKGWLRRGRNPGLLRDE